MTRRRRPVGAITPTPLQNRGKMYITIDPIVVSCSKFFHKFPEAVFDEVAWNPYDTPMTSGRGNYTYGAREPGQMVHNYSSDRWIVLKFLSLVSRSYFRWSGVESVRHADDVRSGPFHRQR